MFLKAVTRLPQVHGEWLFAAELADSGLLAVYPKTHWKELGLAPAGTRQSKWAFSTPPVAQAPTVSSPTPSSFPPCFSLPITASSSVSPSLLSSVLVSGSECVSQPSCRFRYDCRYAT